MIVVLACVALAWGPHTPPCVLPPRRHPGHSFRCRVVKRRVPLLSGYRRPLLACF